MVESPRAQPSDPAGPGRLCPLDYRYGSKAVGADPAIACDSAWIVGGLYGNLEALTVIERAHAADPVAGARLVFNGDFHWFDADRDWFAQVQQRVLRHDALRGNVETECARASFDAEIGCGCAYPTEVDDGVVMRSNRILAELWHACHEGGHASALSGLPMYRHLRVGGARVAVVHGDLESLAGWSFDAAALSQDAGWAQAQAQMAGNRFDIVASSHTCTPAVRRFEHRAQPDRATLLVNNGSAGMANLRADRAGLVTRLASVPLTELGTARLAELGLRTMFRGQHAGIWVEALAVDFDHAAWQQRFASRWPDRSDAELSYGARIRTGGTVSIDDVYPLWTIGHHT